MTPYPSKGQSIREREDAVACFRRALPFRSRARLFIFITLVLLSGCGQKSDLGFGPSGPPEVLLKSPADGTVNFSSNSLDNPREVSALFNKDMDPTSVRSNISLTKECNSFVGAQPSSPAYNKATRIVTYRPSLLEANQQYKVVIGKEARDLQGTTLGTDVVWRFSTGPAIDRDPPIFEGLRSVDLNGSTELTLRWSAGVDFQGVTSQDKLKYLVYQGQGVAGGGVGSSCQVNFSFPTKTLESAEVCGGLDQDPDTAECSYQVTGLTANTQYCFAVRARDRGCFTDLNQRVGAQATGKGGKLYLANFAPNNLLLFDNAGEAEKITPRSIRSDQTRFIQPLNTLFSSYPEKDSGGNVIGQKNVLYVTNFAGNTVSVFEWDQGGPIPSGDIAPTRIFEGAAAAFSAPSYLAFLDDNAEGDALDYDLYISNTNSNTITVYKDANRIKDTKSAVPVRIVIGAATDFSRPVGIAVDNRNTPSPLDDLLYVAYRDTNNIAILDGVSNATGSKSPNWVISSTPLVPDRTRINRPSGLFLDTELDRLYISSRGVEDKKEDDEILIFDQVSVPEVRSQSNRAPSYIIESSEIHEPTTLSIVKYQEGNPAVVKKRLYLVSRLNFKILGFNDIDARLNPTDCPPSSLNGNVPTCNLTPDFVLTRPHGQIFNPSGVLPVPQGGEDTLFVTNVISVEVFEHIPSGASLSLAQEPQKMIAPSVYGPAGVSLGPPDKTLYLSSFLGNSISLFKDLNVKDATTNLLPNGNIPPTRRIFGPQTRLSGPVGLAEAGGRLYVANLSGNNLLAFDLADLDNPALCNGLDCDIAPISEGSFSKPDLPIISPIGIAVDPRITTDPNDDVFFVSYRDQKLPIEKEDNDGNAIVVYKLGTDGVSLLPAYVIKDASGGLRGPAGMFLDAFRSELYVANRFGFPPILVFDVHRDVFEDQSLCTANTQQPDFISVCTLTPIRSIQHHPEPPIQTNPFAQLIVGLHFPNDLFLNTKYDPPKLYVTNLGSHPSDFDAEEAILVYNNGNTANGAIEADRKIVSSSIAPFWRPFGIVLDPDE